MITKQKITEEANKLGFELVGFATTEKLEKEVGHLKDWISKGYQAGMKYMEKNLDRREDISLILKEARSVVSLGMIYNTNYRHEYVQASGKISRYAWGKDYHIVIWEKLELLENKLKEIDPEFKCKSYVDTGPMMDKAWAVRAGLGWLGKNTNVINRRHGSWFFIANIITNLPLESDSPAEDLCGSCTACIDACPTNAIIDEYLLDSNKCISYLTIENKGIIPQDFKSRFDNWIFGCDICQDVCPWNIRFGTFTDKEEFKPNENTYISIAEIEQMTNSDFRKRFGQSPVSRARLKGLKRNAAFIKT